MASQQLEKLEQARALIKSQTRRSDYAELMAFHKPPTKVIELLSLVLILLGVKPLKQSGYEWMEIVKTLNSHTIIDSITKLDKVEKETLDTAKAFINQHPDTFSERSIGNCSITLAFHLVSWSLAFINYAESQQ